MIEQSHLLGAYVDGKMPRSDAEREAVPIFLKQACHAISLRKLLPSIEFADGELWDIGSACALARCVIEAYDALAYFCQGTADAEEMDFRHLLSELHDQERRAKMLGFIGSNAPEAAAIRRRSQDLRSRTKTHPFFSRLGKEQQSRIAKGDAPQYYLSQRQRNEAADIDHRHYQAATMHLSQFVHTTPMAINQWRHFKAGGIGEMRSMMLTVQYALPYFASGIYATMSLFDQLEVSQPLSDALDFWLVVARQGVPGRGPVSGDS